MKILLVDDHQIFRESLIRFLTNESFCEETFEAEDVEHAQRIISTTKPDLLITDLSLPNRTGVSLIDWCRTNAPNLRIICLTMHAEIPVLRDALAAGAHGFVTKSSGYDELITGLQAVGKGNYFLDQVMLTKAIRRMIGDPTPIENDENPLGVLTEREREVFYRLIEDDSPGEIASLLFISTKTVENHRSSIYRKLGIHDRYGLYTFARENGLLD